jgi:cell fate regulator YaaT (PSP1 superfamily)
LQQIGVRDEAKVFGDFGPCGRKLCCTCFLNELGNVSTDFAKNQQIAHRGSERLSGLCDRLKCCLRYEEPVYQELSKNFPAIGEKIKTKSGEGIVTDWHVLKGTVDVNIGTEEEKMIVEMPIKK